ncbi:MAG: 16S rRNA (guanine(527)-N(7))-methyltransferase RsmG [Dehalococcoidia bacterium]
MSTARAPLETLRAEASRLGLELNEATIGQFETYLEMLLDWRDRAGLTAITERAAVEQRHFGESLALLVALRRAGILAESGQTRVADLGTGAGFPGLPMRIVDPTIDLALVESNGRRCRFLETVVDALQLEGVQVLQARAEDAGRNPALRGSFDLVVVRALAAFPILVEFAVPLLREGGVLAAPKGSRAIDELAEAAPALAALGAVSEPPLQLSLPPGAAAQHVLIARRVGPLDDRFPRRPGIPAKRPLR